MNLLPQLSPGSVVSPVLSWLNVHHHNLFVSLADGLSNLVSVISSALSFAPSYVTIAVLALIFCIVSNWRGAVLFAVGMLACDVLGMWAATVQTIAVIALSVTFSVLVGVPLGVLVSRRQWMVTAIRPVLDVMQTLPPWVYLVPAVILFGLGVVPAVLSTIIYGIPPMIRLTILAMSQIPRGRVELGHSIGATQRTIFYKIELPSAMPTLLVGINQCVLFSLGMVVLAGLVGAGGLGSEVTRGLSRMDFGLGMRASLAIVLLAIVLDRVFRGAIPKKFLMIA